MSTIYSISNIFKETRRSLQLALPLITAEIIHALNGFIATIMVARLGNDQLAAYALVWGVYIAILLFVMGLYSGIGILIAQSYGAQDERGIAISFKQGLILAIFSSFLVMIIFWFSPIVLDLTKQDPTITAFAKPLFHLLVWCVLPFSLLFMMEQFLIGTGKTKIVMWLSIALVPIQLFFYYLFIFGKFGVPAFGLQGIGYSMIVSFYIIAIVFICYLYFSKNFKSYSLFNKWWIINKKFLFEIIRVGLPLGCIYSLEVGLFATVAFMMGILGPTTLAAYQISYQYLMIGIVLIFAMTQSTTVRIGHEVGRQNRENLKLAAFVNIGISLVFMGIFGIFYSIFPLTMISVDINISLPANQPIIEQATLFLSIISVLMLSDSIRLISLGALRGLKDTKFPLVATIVGFWCIAFPLAYFFGFKLSYGGEGIWWAMVIGLFSAGIILFTRFNRLVRRADLKKMLTR